MRSRPWCPAGLALDPESRACAYSTPQRRAGRLPCVLPSPAPPLPGPILRKSSRATCCPCERGCAGARWTGKPLQIAVDDVRGTTEATRHPRHPSRPMAGETRQFWLVYRDHLFQLSGKSASGHGPDLPLAQPQSRMTPDFSLVPLRCYIASGGGPPHSLL